MIRATHSRYVLDASVTAKWFTRHDEEGPGPQGLASVGPQHAAYVALAEREGFPRLTADEVVVRKMEGHSIVIRLRDMQIV